MGRRAPGEGTIFKRSNGRWVSEVDLGYGPDNRRVRKTFYGKTRAEVQAKKDRALREIQTRGGLGSSMLLSSLLDRWLDEVVATEARPSTLRVYRLRVKNHINPALGNLRLSELTPQAIQSFLNGIDLEPATVASIRRTLVTCLGHAVSWGFIPSNPGSLTSAPRIERKRVNPYDAGEIARLLAVADEHPLGALVYLAATCGLRMGECLALHWVDVDLDARRLRVEYTAARAADGWYIGAPKTKSSRRVVSIPRLTVERLASHRERELGLHHGRLRELVMTTGPGGMVTPRQVGRAYHAMRTEARLRSQVFHGLRHSYATLLLSSGVPITVVSKSMGHASVKQTLDTYSHLLPGQVEQAADAIDGLLGKP